jgi:hypothetical protein
MIYILVLLMCGNVQAGNSEKFDAWSNRVTSSECQPKWKKSLVNKSPKLVNAKFTRYSDDDNIDPGTGGGPFGCTWTNPDGKRYSSVSLRWGYMAADLRHWPTGSCFYSPQLDRMMIVVDCGPGVRGRGRFDIYCGNWAEWNLAKRKCGSSGSLYYLGRITKKQATDR